MFEDEDLLQADGEETIEETLGDELFLGDDSEDAWEWALDDSDVPYR